MQDHNKHTLEVYKFCLETNEIRYGGFFFLKKIKHESSLLKQKKISLNKFDDERRYIDK